MASGLGAAAAAILDVPFPAATRPILARRKAIEKSIADAKRQEREDHELARAKKALTVEAHRPLAADAERSQAVASTSAPHDPALEKRLKKIATQGIVTLFNAVRQAQGVRDEKKGKKRLRTPEAATSDAGSVPVQVTKDSFLDILRRGSRDAAAPRSNGDGRTSYLRDDYLIGKKPRTKDFGADLPEDEEDVDEAQHEADFELEDDEI
mmetsp:Transcript_5616/g.14329  ORF Transcript_5616/g.14329 Transcript_5616/m.14329 type:complete len:209 (-) Transcript_5616:9-635(-)